jgi:hypothetical protein
MPEQCATFLNKKTTERGHWSATGTSFAVVAKIWAQRTRRLNLHVVIRSAKYPRTRLGSPLLLLNIHSWSRAEATKQTSTVYNMSASIEASTCTRLRRLQTAGSSGTTAPSPQSGIPVVDGATVTGPRPHRMHDELHLSSMSAFTSSSLVQYIIRLVSTTHRPAHVELPALACHP